MASIQKTFEPLNAERLLPLGIRLDDLLNQIFYGAWRGGLLEFPLPEELFGGGGGGGLFSDLQIDISGSETVYHYQSGIDPDVPNERPGWLGTSAALRGRSRTCPMEDSTVKPSPR